MASRLLCPSLFAISRGSASQLGNHCGRGMEYLEMKMMKDHMGRMNGIRWTDRAGVLRTVLPIWIQVEEDGSDGRNGYL